MSKQKVGIIIDMYILKLYRCTNITLLGRYLDKRSEYHRKLLLSMIESIMKSGNKKEIDKLYDMLGYNGKK